jgi:nickel-type superoxide dismutase maturation protease
MRKPPLVRLAILAAFFALLARIISRYFRIEVKGSSMEPCLFDGDRLIAKRIGSNQRLNPGEIAVLTDPRDCRPLIKRVLEVNGRGVFVVGDNESRSTDSRTFGPVARSAILGKVVYRYYPQSRAGKVSTERSEVV